VVLSIEERVFLVEYVFREGNRYTELVQQQFAEKFPETPVPHRNAVRRLNREISRNRLSVRRRTKWDTSKFNDRKLMDISDYMLRSPSKSMRKLAQEEDIWLATAHKAVRENSQLSWTSLPTTFVSAQRLSESTVFVQHPTNQTNVQTFFVTCTYHQAKTDLRSPVLKPVHFCIGRSTRGLAHTPIRNGYWQIFTVSKGRRCYVITLTIIVGKLFSCN
jgi:hypothetical protein